MKGYLFLASLLIFASVQGQSEFVHMQYNLTLYGNPFGCEDSQNDVDLKDQYLKEIVAYSGASFLCVNELGDEDVLADRILNNSLNVDGQSNWARAELTDFATPSSILNAFYYRSDLFTLESQWYINQSVSGEWLLRPIDMYTGFINPSAGWADTTFITFAVCHLSASDEVERAAQTEALMDEIVNRGVGNYILSGDFNIDSSSEESFQNLISPIDMSIALHDPVEAYGNWSSNGQYAMYHTQSTRFSDTNGGCFVGGGLDDRFDFTMISEPVLTGQHGLIYTPDSYHVLGQGGDNYNSELMISANTVVPNDIALSLYEMSDHLPVISSYQLISPTSLEELVNLQERIKFLNPVEDEVLFFCNMELDVKLTIIDLSGKEVMAEQVSLKNGYRLNVTHLEAGMYLVYYSSDKGEDCLGKLLKY